MIDMISNYEKAKISMARVFLQYDQAAMIHKYSLEYDSGWLYITLCYSKDGCHLANEFVNINSLSTIMAGNLSQNSGFFKNTADFFNGKTVELRNACVALSGKELEKGDVAFKLNLFPFLPIIIRFWEADDEFPASLQILADRNTLDYMHYETLMFALTHLFSRLKEEMQNEER